MTKEITLIIPTYTPHLMIIDESCCLHIGVADRRSDEGESILFQRFTHRFGEGNGARTLSVGHPMIHDRSISYEAPDIRIERSVFCDDFLVGESIFFHAEDFEFIFDDIIFSHPF